MEIHQVTHLPIGSIALSKGTVRLSEPADQARTGANSPIAQLSFDDDENDISLDDIRALRALLGEAEKRLLKRKEQAVKAANLTLF